MRYYFIIVNTISFLIILFVICKDGTVSFTMRCQHGLKARKFLVV